jgi:hypothetical protein
MTKRLLAALAMILGLHATAFAQDDGPAPAQSPSVTPAPPSALGALPPPSTPGQPTPASPARASSGAAGEFGDAGQVVIAVDVPFQNEASQLGFVRSTTMGSTSTIVLVRPSADYFVTPRVSVGGLIGFARGDVAFGEPGVSSESSITELMVGVRAGYDVRMTELVSIWGRIELIYKNLSGGGSGHELPVVVNVPILLHPAPHFFLGAGPMFSRDLIFRFGGTDIPKTTDYGLQGIIGGYIGG